MAYFPTGILSGPHLSVCACHSRPICALAVCGCSLLLPPLHQPSSCPRLGAAVAVAGTVPQSPRGERWGRNKLLSMECLGHKVGGKVRPPPPPALQPTVFPDPPPPSPLCLHGLFLYAYLCILTPPSTVVFLGLSAYLGYIVIANPYHPSPSPLSRPFPIASGNASVPFHSV